MVSTEEKRALPTWVGVIAIIAVLAGVILYGVHVLRGQAPNSDLSMPSSHHLAPPPNT